jgi:DNA-binding response OmpR family regulator
MPASGGLGILAALRAARCGVHIILMTAFGDDETRASAGALGARLFDKPFDLKQLPPCGCRARARAPRARR